MSHNILAPILVKVKSDSKKRKKTWSWRPQGGYPPETPVRVGPLKKLALYAPSRGVLVTEMTPRENFGVRTSYSESSEYGNSRLRNSYRDFIFRKS